MKRTGKGKEKEMEKEKKKKIKKNISRARKLQCKQEVADRKGRSEEDGLRDKEAKA